TVAQRSKRELESFRVQVRQKLAAEVERLKAELGAGKQRGLAESATTRLFAEAPVVDAGVVEDEGLPLVVGATVRHRALGWQGTLEKLAGGRAEVAAGGKRLRCRADELVAIAAPREGAKTAAPAAPGARDRRGGAHARVESRPAPR